MRARPTVRTAALATGAGLMLLALTACGGGSTSATSTTAAAVATPAASGEASDTIAGDFAAYRECMADNGVDLPDRGTPPSGMPSGMPSGAPPSGAPGGGFPGGLPEGVNQETYDAAQAACASLAPQMGPGGAGPGALDATALAAFTSCLTDHDVTVPEGDDPLGSLDRSDPTVQAALETCAPLIPAIGGQPTAGS
jgi:hypothetical protein